MKNVLLVCLLAVSSLASAQVAPIKPNSPEWKETFEPSGNSDMAALWLRTREGWKLVDYAVGFGDPFYWVWAEQYGAPRKLLGMP